MPPAAWAYSGCQKFFPMAEFQIPMNPPFSKGVFQRNFAKFPPLAKGGRGDLGSWSKCNNGKDFRASCKIRFSVILNEVKDLNLLKIRDSSLHSELQALSMVSFARSSFGIPYILTHKYF
jgi:hypothetical protein